MKSTIILFCFSMLLVSCSGLKFKPYFADVDYLERNGPIAYVEYIEFTSKNPNDIKKIGIAYNDKNLPSKQIDFGKGKRGDQVTYLKYDSASRLIEQIPDSPRAPWHYKLYYDSKGNLINHNSFTNDTLMHDQRYYYDKHNNLIKEESYKKGELHYETYYTNDYKNRVSTATYYVKGVKSKNFSKRYYDKKGHIIGTAFVTDEHSSTYQVKISYDKFGNVTTIQHSKSKTENVHTYDDKNNLIKTLVFIDGQLYQTKIYNITYR